MKTLTLTLTFLLTFTFTLAKHDICPEFTYETRLGNNYALSLPPALYSYEEAQSICNECVFGNLADIPNALILESQNSGINGTYWIRSYDGGELVPSLVWTRGITHAITVNPSRKRQVMCQVEVMYRNRTAVAVFLDFVESNTSMTGEVLFSEQMLGVKLSGRFSGLEEGKSYHLNILSYGDLRNPPSSLGSTFNPEQRTSNLIGDLGNLMFIGQSDSSATFEYVDMRLSLFGFSSIVGRSVALYDSSSELIGYAVIGLAGDMSTSTAYGQSTSNQRNRIIGHQQRDPLHGLQSEYGNEGTMGQQQVQLEDDLGFLNDTQGEEETQEQPQLGEGFDRQIVPEQELQNEVNETIYPENHLPLEQEQHVPDQRPEQETQNQEEISVQQEQLPTLNETQTQEDFQEQPQLREGFERQIVPGPIPDETAQVGIPVEFEQEQPTESLQQNGQENTKTLEMPTQLPESQQSVQQGIQRQVEQGQEMQNQQEQLPSQLPESQQSVQQGTQRQVEQGQEIQNQQEQLPEDIGHGQMNQQESQSSSLVQQEQLPIQLPENQPSVQQGTQRQVEQGQEMQNQQEQLPEEIGHGQMNQQESQLPAGTDYGQQGVQGREKQRSNRYRTSYH